MFKLPAKIVRVASNSRLCLILSILSIISSNFVQGKELVTACPVVETAENFDIGSYASASWYSHQQAENAYQPLENNYCVKAEYSVRSKPTLWGYTVDVNNLAQNEFGDEFDGKLCAYQTSGEVDASKLAVAPCFLPKVFAGPYWVVAYNEDEGFALISGGQPTIPALLESKSTGCRTGTGTNNSGLWIFSRSQERNDTLINLVRGIAQDSGFDISVLNDVDQRFCDV